MVVEAKSKGSVLDDIPIVKELSDVFSEDLPSLPLDREVEFIIDLGLGTNHISKAPYGMALVKLRE